MCSVVVGVRMVMKPHRMNDLLNTLLQQQKTATTTRAGAPSSRAVPCTDAVAVSSAVSVAIPHAPTACRAGRAAAAAMSDSAR